MKTDFLLCEGYVYLYVCVYTQACTFVWQNLAKKIQLCCTPETNTTLFGGFFWGGMRFGHATGLVGS